MNQVVYFIGGPADLTKRVLRPGETGDIYVPHLDPLDAERLRREAHPQDVVGCRYARYTVRRLRDNIFVAVFDDAWEAKGA